MRYSKKSRRFKKFEANSIFPKRKSKGVVIKEEKEKDKKKGVNCYEYQRFGHTFNPSVLTP